MSKHNNHMEGLLKYKWLGAIPRVSDSVGLRIFMFNKFLGDIDVSGLGNHTWKTNGLQQSPTKLLIVKAENKELYKGEQDEPRAK